MYSGPSCFSSRLARVAISWAVYSLTRGLASSNGLVAVAVARCWSPGLVDGQQGGGHGTSAVELTLACFYLSLIEIGNATLCRPGVDTKIE